MKRLSIVEGVFGISIALIAFGTLSSTTTYVPRGKNISVIGIGSVKSVSTPTISFSGSTTLTEHDELMPGETIPSKGTSTIRATISPTLDINEVVIEFTVNSQCKVWGIGGKEGYGQPANSISWYIKNYHDVNVGPAPDSIFEGTHGCVLIATLTSNDNPEYNGISKTLTLKIIDNDPEPESTEKAPETTKEKTPTIDIVKPNIPEAKLIDSDGEELKPTITGELISYHEGSPVVISGTTIPNGVVKLYIFSEPREASVTADDTGVWTYTVEDLEPGDHRIEVEVTDPETGETSERTEVLAFQVAQIDEITNETQLETVEEELADDEDNSYAILVIIAGLIVVVGLGVSFWWWRKKKSNDNTNSPSTQPDPIPPTSDTSNNQ